MAEKIIQGFSKKSMKLRKSLKCLCYLRISCQLEQKTLQWPQQEHILTLAYSMRTRSVFLWGCWYFISYLFPNVMSRLILCADSEWTRAFIVTPTRTYGVCKSILPWMKTAVLWTESNMNYALTMKDGVEVHSQYRRTSSHKMQD